MSGSHPDDDRLNREAFTSIARLSSDVTSLAAVVHKVAEMAELADRTLRGSNGTVGVVAYVERHGFDIELLQKKIDLIGADVRDRMLALENDLQMVRLPGKVEEAKWYARGKFWLWLGAATGVVGHLATLASIILERFA